MKKAIKYGIKLISWLAYPVGLFFKRNKRIWLFGGYNGFTDNSRYFFESINKYSDIRCVWITDDKKTLRIIRDAGYEAYHKKSIKGIMLCYMAKVYIYSNYVSTINFYTSAGATLVNLWHGTPLKKIEYDIMKKPLNNFFNNAGLFYKLLMPEYHKRCDILLAPSDFVYEYFFKSAFRAYDENNVIIADPPRISALIDKEKEYKIIGSCNVQKIKTFLYAPTWRDDGSDFIKKSGLNFSTLNDLLSKNNALLQIRLHANTKLDIDITMLTNIFIIDNGETAEESMLKSDFLITDYSSIFFDYLYLDRPIIFFPFDYNEYLSSRDIYLNYNDIVPGVKVYNQEDLISEMLKMLKGDDGYYDVRKNITNKFCSLERRDDLYIMKEIEERINEN
ncbi:CDP-glycerol glycerophosphotransferase (TagB/SpsB family) [Buttiauxella sp. BIGb0471]|uniref:CDP-glycerol glycerophosphotransferase family protein n=1 Tax=Buttiauxella sp. BIGb0471 TaxID=2940597 RepID=UPI002167DE4E|nr:CDP-glycerol glycerophosphotransferase family protein [Buttiauxella sp. BIGb0471]MCS3601273.1 CDP-glycerol glycerophosphotransferase (TagB/SpsB family) [Buttiauxella sp. BIGb0471]